jgi:hypothetical protein
MLMRMWSLVAGVFGVVLLGGCGGTSPPVDEVLEDFHAAIVAGDVEAAMDTFADDAEWRFDEIEFTLDDPVPEQLQWLLDAFALEEDATGAGIIRAYTEYLVAARATPTVTNCVGDDAKVLCTYHAEDALSPLTGFPEFGTVEATVESGRLIRYALIIDSVEDEPSEDAVAFRRWSAVQDPETLNPFGPVASDVEQLLAVYDAWKEAGRPDIAPAVVLDDPVEIAKAWFAANNNGDWETQVSLTGGDALWFPFASRDEFEAARLLEREVRLDACSVTLETEDSVRIACDVSVTDIITVAAGVVSTNPNQVSMEVADGRMTEAPVFLPSQFAAETEIEKWAQREEPENYRRACPEGIAGQSAIVGLSCARFILTYQGHWAPLVAELGLGSAD